MRFNKTAVASTHSTTGRNMASAQMGRYTVVMCVALTLLFGEMPSSVSTTRTYRVSFISDGDSVPGIGLQVDDKNRSIWTSRFLEGTLIVDPISVTADLLIRNGRARDNRSTSMIVTGYNHMGRGAEFSDLVLWNNALHTVDDKTGIVFYLHQHFAVIPHIIIQGNIGSTAPGFKGEWMTVKDNLLYIGSRGIAINGNTRDLWVVVVNHFGGKRFVDWTANYEAVRRAYNLSPGQGT